MLQVPVFAHRGASGYVLENTIQSFEKAKKLGADGIELDVQCTKDDVLVVYHDLNLLRLTGVKKQIDACYADELFRMKLGKNFLQRKCSHYQIPSLLHIIDWANIHQISLNIELKESLLDCVQPFVSALHHMNLPKGSHFSSFHDELLKIVKMHRPDIETAILVTKHFDWTQIKKLTYFDTIHAHKKYYKKHYLNYCEQANRKLRFYSIDGTESFLTNPNANVIGWITDYPDRIKQIQKKTFKQ